MVEVFQNVSSQDALKRLIRNDFLCFQVLDWDKFFNAADYFEEL